MTANEGALPTVDVVVPCYNYAHYLADCVATVLSQRDVTVRVLIVDDQSPDNTPDIAAQLTAEDRRVSYVRNEANLGLIGTANRGVMDWAQADYVVLLSADDLLTPGALARATRLMEAHPSVALVYGMALMLGDETIPVVGDVHDAPAQIIDGHSAIRRMFKHGNIVPTPAAVMRTSVQHRIGGYDARFKHTSDLDTWLRAAAAGSIGVVNAVGALYRWHATNMSAAYQRRPLGDGREVLATYRDFTRRFAEAAPELNDLLGDAERGMCWRALLVANEFFGDAEIVADAVAFAREADTGYRLQPLWWKLQFKRLIGPAAARSLRDRRRSLRALPLEPERSWFEHGNQIGWWPQN